MHMEIETLSHLIGYIFLGLGFYQLWLKLRIPMKRKQHQQEMELLFEEMSKESEEINFNEFESRLSFKSKRTVQFLLNKSSGDVVRVQTIPGQISEGVTNE